MGQRLVGLVGLVGLVVVMALLASACSGGDDGLPDSSSVTHSSVATSMERTDPVVTDDGTPIESSRDVEHALTGVGVQILEWPGEPLGAASGLELTAFQVSAMDRQLATGHGIVGASLDELIGAPGGMPISFLIAAWLTTEPTPMASQAAALMGHQPWEQAPSLVYPTAVLAMFAMDTANAANGTTAQGLVGSNTVGSQTIAELRAAPGGTGVCSDLTAWFGGILDFLFDSLKADTDELFGFLAEIWNAAIDLARATLGGVIKVLTAPLVAIVAEVIGVIGTLGMVTSLLVPWSAELTETDQRPSFAVGGGPDNDQRFTVSVDTNLDVEWPAEVEDCASVAGFDLPDPGEAVGSPIDWLVVGLPRNGSETQREATLDDENQAGLDWVTGREESADGEAEIGVVSATATVTSTQIVELRAMLESLLAGFVPVAPFGEIVEAMFVDLAGPVFDRFADLVQVSGSTSVRVVHHEQIEPETTTAPTTPQPPEFDLSSIDPCAIISFEEAALPLNGTPTETQLAGEGVSFSGFANTSCRYIAQLTPRLDQRVGLIIGPDGDGRLDTVANWNPWGYWDVVALPGVGDGAWLRVSNGSIEFGSPAGTIHSVVAAADGVLVSASVDHTWPATPDGLIAIVELVLERAASS